MKYWYQRPAESLAEFVRTVLILEGFSTHDPESKPLVTNGMPALFCKTQKDEAGSERIVDLILFGKSTTSACWVTDEHTTTIAFFFKPFAIASLFNLHAKKLADKPLDLRMWNAHKINALITQLGYAATTSHKIEILEGLLMHQLNENKRECEIIRYATDQIMFNSNTEILSDVVTSLRLHERTFQRMFKKYVGVTPNQYRRICQFQLSFAQVRSQEFQTLTDVAYDNGFADQSHFIRSFKEFTETTPNTYLRSGLKEKKL
jgi:AraC-like DNA-binding protein